MPRALILEELTDSGATQIAQIDRNDIAIGRDPGEGVRVAGTAVSRVHGRFIQARQHWLYMDLGSTNGSWLNGKQILDGQVALIRPGDILQLADSAVRILGILNDGSLARRVGDDPQSAIRSLLLFSAGQFLDEFPVSDFGRSLVIGGAQCDVSLDEAGDVPALVVEKRGAELVAFSLATAVRVTAEGVPITSVIPIKDGDRLRVGNYLVVVNSLDIAPSAQLSSPAEVPFSAPPSRGSSTGLQKFKDWDADSPAEAPGEDRARRRSSRIVFGQGMVEEQSEVAQTVAMDPERVKESVARFERHPAAKTSSVPNPIERSPNVDDRLVLLIGFGLLVVLIGLAMYWFLA